MSWAFIDIERRYATPAHAPDWRGEDRPPWTRHSEEHKRAFVAWAIRQLEELERRVRAERIAEIEAAWNTEIVPAARKLGETLEAGWPQLHQKIAGVRLAKPGATINDIVGMERLQEVRKASGWKGGSGRPASGADPKSPAALAAQDIWRLRQVILSRFWPEAGKGGHGPTNEELAKIAASRHQGAKPSAALHWYRNEKLPREATSQVK